MAERNLFFLGGVALGAGLVLLLSMKKRNRKVILDDRNKPGNKGFVYNKAHIIDGIAHISGQVAIQYLMPEKKEVDLEEEIRQCLENLKTVVEMCGSSMDKVLKTDCLLSDIEDYATFNKVYSTFFSDNAIKPARVCYAAKQLPLKARVEVACTAYVE